MSKRALFWWGSFEGTKTFLVGLNTIKNLRNNNKNLRSLLSVANKCGHCIWARMRIHR